MMVRCSLIYLIIFFFTGFFCFAQNKKQVAKQHPKFRHKKYISVSPNAQFNLSTKPLTLTLDSSRNLRRELLQYGSTFLGIKYKVAGHDPKGFDCSGYVYYVFRKFNIHLYTSAVYMFQQGKPVNLEEAREGDIIYFTSTTSKNIGHVGIVTSKHGDPIQFIHSSSGKEYCVKYEALQPNYIKRYIGIKRMID